MGSGGVAAHEPHDIILYHCLSHCHKLCAPLHSTFLESFRPSFAYLNFFRVSRGLPCRNPCSWAKSQVDRDRSASETLLRRPTTHGGHTTRVEEDCTFLYYTTTWISKCWKARGSRQYRTPCWDHLKVQRHYQKMMACDSFVGRCKRSGTLPLQQQTWPQECTMS